MSSEVLSCSLHRGVAWTLLLAASLVICAGCGDTDQHEERGPGGRVSWAEDVSAHPWTDDKDAVVIVQAIKSQRRSSDPKNVPSMPKTLEAASYSLRHRGREGLCVILSMLGDEDLDVVGIGFSMIGRLPRELQREAADYCNSGGSLSRRTALASALFREGLVDQHLLETLVVRCLNSQDTGEHHLGVALSKQLEGRVNLAAPGLIRAAQEADEGEVSYQGIALLVLGELENLRKENVASVVELILEWTQIVDARSDGMKVHLSDPRPALIKLLGRSGRVAEAALPALRRLAAESDGPIALEAREAIREIEQP